MREPSSIPAGMTFRLSPPQTPGVAMLEDGVTLIEAVVLVILVLAFWAPAILAMLVAAIASIPIAIAARIAGLVRPEEPGPSCDREEGESLTVARPTILRPGDGG
jgi:hypothetical protein